jgi:hypothetical protein
VSRALDLLIEPEAHRQHGLRVCTYTYSYDVRWPAMRESIYVQTECGPINLQLQLTADEARVLANQLLLVADQADEHKARRTSLEDIQEQLRDPAFDARVVHFVHPDVVYAKPGSMSEVAKANPGKVVISLQHDDAGQYQGGIAMANAKAAA